MINHLKHETGVKTANESYKNISKKANSNLKGVYGRLNTVLYRLRYELGLEEDLYNIEPTEGEKESDEHPLMNILEANNHIAEESFNIVIEIQRLIEQSFD